MSDRPWHHVKHRGWIIALVVVLVVLVAARLAMPAIIKKVVNSKLENMPGGFQGSAESIDVRMLDGEIGLQQFRIVKKNGLVPVPFMKMQELVLGTVRDSWKLRSTLRFVQPDASFVYSKSEAKKQYGPPGALDRLQGQLPFQLLWIKVEDGTFHFRDYEPKPDIDVFAKHVYVFWDKLVGCLPPGFTACRSNVKGRADLLESGKLQLKGTFVRAPEAEFKADASIENLRAPELNPVLKNYAKIEIQRGKIDLDAHYAQRGKRRDVTVVPYLRDFKLMGEDRDKESTSFVRQIGVAAAAGFFEKRQGEKAVRITSKPSGTDFELIDLKEKREEKREDKDER